MQDLGALYSTCLGNSGVPVNVKAGDSKCFIQSMKLVWDHLICQCVGLIRQGGCSLHFTQDI